MFNWICDSLIFIVVVISIIFIIFVGWLIYDSSPKVEILQDLAKGQLISIRCTGAWSHYDIELKFKDGSLLLVPYSFSRNLKEGHKYKIWWSSFYGWQYKELK